MTSLAAMFQGDAFQTCPGMIFSGLLSALAQQAGHKQALGCRVEAGHGDARLCVALKTALGEHGTARHVNCPTDAKRCTQAPARRAGTPAEAHSTLSPRRRMAGTDAVSCRRPCSYPMNAVPQAGAVSRVWQLVFRVQGPRAPAEADSMLSPPRRMASTEAVSCRRPCS